MADDFQHEFLRALSTIRQYLPDVIIVGGCVPFIYAEYLFSISSKPVYTRDLDLLVENEIPIRDRSIASLMLEAGYDGRTLKSNHIQYYKFQSRAGTGFEVEFLTTLPEGKDIDNTVVQGGLRAQILPSLTILEENPMEVRITDNIDSEKFNETVRVPTPAAFTFSKLVSYVAPLGQDRIKDIYYVYYIVRNTPVNKMKLATEMKSATDSCSIKMLVERLEPLFASQYSQGPREVARQLTGTNMTDANKHLLAHQEISELIEMMKSVI
ncbi:MAG: hypothetical protein JW738_03630 [Actinobacteria bacterium]|nr:hypothetical protein [Actinomycetota bacterium]